MNNTGYGARWPVYIDAVVRDYGPLRADEQAIFLRIASRAGWDGNWCVETAKNMAEAYADLCERIVSDVRRFLVEARMIEKRQGRGRNHELRPRWPTEWVDAVQLEIIRGRIYAYRGRKQRAPENVEVLSMKSKDIEKRQGKRTDQLSLVSLSQVFDFTLDDSMHDWAARECSQVIHLGQITQKFIAHMEKKVKDGYDITRVDLR